MPTIEERRAIWALYERAYGTTALLAPVLPVFTSTEPAPFGSHGRRNDELIYREAGKRVLFPAGKWSFRPGKPVVGYYHGKLEGWIGYDVPLWLRGEIRNVPRQACKVWNVEGTECRDAVLLLEEREARFYYLIVLPEEADTTARWLPRQGDL